MAVETLGTPPTLVNEEQRLQALRRWQAGWTDLEARQAQALVQVCAQAVGAPMAALGWMDQHQWVPLVASEPGQALAACAKAHTPCAYTVVHAQAPWQVHDLLEDPRWAQSPWMLADQWRAYAGAAICNAQGLPLATLIVLDRRPRNWQAGALAQLHDLAQAAAAIPESGALRTELALHRVTDTLTGLNNRTHYCQALEVELSHAMRNGEPFTILHLDLDGFKAVKDGFGHAASEHVLREVAQRLSRCIRQGDLVARFGGDEFGIIMRHGGKDSAQVLAKRIVKSVSAPIVLPSGDEIGVGASVGMAAYSDQVLTTATLLERADQALYQAKQQNEKRWKMFVGIR